MRYTVYYKNDNGTFRCLDNYTQRKPYDYKNVYRMKHAFELLKGYEQNDDGLEKFLIDFKIFKQQLYKSHNKIIDIDYTKYRDHTTALYQIMKPKKALTDNIQPIDWIEHKWIENCDNSGLLYFDNDRLGDKNVDCYGYDFKNFYSSTITDYDTVKFSMKAGKEHTITQFPDNIYDLKHGMFKCNITSVHPHITKLFRFSKNKTYTNVSIVEAYNIKKKGIDINIELIQEENNAYIYDDCIKLSEIYGTTLRKLIKVKQLYPKNKLVKHILGSFWGKLCTKKKPFKLIEDKIDDFNTFSSYNEIVDPTIKYTRIVGFDYDDDEGTLTYDVIDRPYKYSYQARMKAFLTSACRKRASYFLLQNIDKLDNLIKVQVDGFIFDSEINKLPKGLIPEDKTTGIYDITTRHFTS